MFGFFFLFFTDSCTVFHICLKNQQFLDWYSRRSDSCHGKIQLEIWGLDPSPLVNLTIFYEVQKKRETQLRKSLFSFNYWHCSSENTNFRRSLSNFLMHILWIFYSYYYKNLGAVEIDEKKTYPAESFPEKSYGRVWMPRRSHYSF